MTNSERMAHAALHAAKESIHGNETGGGIGLVAGILTAGALGITGPIGIGIAALGMLGGAAIEKRAKAPKSYHLSSNLSSTQIQELLKKAGNPSTQSLAKTTTAFSKTITCPHCHYQFDGTNLSGEIACYKCYHHFYV